MHKILLLLLVLLMAPLQPDAAMAQAAGAKKSTDAAKAENAAKAATKAEIATKGAKVSKAANSFKTATAGFSFLVEAVPAWVVPVAPGDAMTLPGNAALQYGLIDEQINLDGKVNYFHHVERRIAALAALGQGAQIQIGFDPSYQELILHRVEVVRNGQRLDKLDPKRVQLLQRETQLEARIYDGRITASMVLDDVRVGDRVEYSYTVRGSNPVFDGKFVLLNAVGSHNGPVALHRLRVVYPQARTLQFSAPKSMQVTQTKSNGQNELLLQQHQLPQTTYEEGASASAYMSDMIQISEFANWNEVARWASALFAPTAKANSERLNQQVASWRARSPDQAGQLQIALDFVQKEVRYFGTEIGVNSHKPAMPDKVLEQRFGDCKDKSALLIAALRALGLEARPVLVSTTFQEQTDAMLPSPLAFNHAIAQLTLDGKTWWIDPTREQQTGPINQRQVHDYGKVLLASDDAAALVALPDGLNVIAQEVEDRFQIPTMEADPVLESTTTWHGSMAEKIRAWLGRTPMAEVQTALAKPYLRPFPQLKIKAPLRVEEVKDQNALRVIQTFDVPGFWTFSKYDILKGSTLLWSLEQQLEHPQHVARKAPLRITLPGVYRHVAVFQFGEDLLDVAKEEKWSDGQANFSLNLQYRTSARERRIEGELRFTGVTVAPAQWRSYVDKTKQVRPRLFPEVHAHLLDKAQLATMEKEVQTLVKSGHWRTSTQQQRTLKIMVKYYNEILLSNRMPPAMLGEGLVMRGMTLMSLGLYDKGADDFEEALKISKGEKPGFYVAAGVAQLFLLKDAAAREYVTKALALAPHDRAAQELNLMIAYQSGDFKTAKTILESNFANEAPDGAYGHMPLLKYLIARQNGEDASAEAELKQQMETADQDSWVYPVMKVLSSKGDVGKTVSQTNMGKANLAQLGKLYFYAAEKARLEGQTENANLYYRLLINMSGGIFYEQASAIRQLARVDKKK